MLTLAADGITSGWIGRLGKVLLLCAGLVAVLDLFESDELQRFAQTARFRCAVAVLHRKYLAFARTQLAEATKLAESAARQIGHARISEVHRKSTGLRRFQAGMALKNYGTVSDTGDRQFLERARAALGLITGRCPCSTTGTAW